MVKGVVGGSNAADISFMDTDVTRRRVQSACIINIISITFNSWARVLWRHLVTCVVRASPFDSAWPLSYRLPIVNNPVTPVFSELHVFARTHTLRTNQTRHPGTHPSSRRGKWQCQWHAVSSTLRRCTAIFTVSFVVSVHCRTTHSVDGVVHWWRGQWPSASLFPLAIMITLAAAAVASLEWVVDAR